MATITNKHVFFNAKAIFDANDFSAFVKSITQAMDLDAVEVTSMGNTDHQYAPGLGNSKLTGELFQDYTATTGVDAIFSAFRFNRSIVTCIFQPDNTNPGTGTAVPATDDPAYSNTYFLSKYQVGGSVGAADMTPFEFSPTGNLQRLTA